MVRNKTQHTGHHQVPLLADDGEESERNLRLYQSRADGVSAGDQEAVYLHRCDGILREN